MIRKLKIAIYNTWVISRISPKIRLIACPRDVAFFGQNHGDKNVYLLDYPKGKIHPSDEEARLLILEFCDKERKKFEKLQRLYQSSDKSQPIINRRERIPEQVRIEVWRRDEGKCARCGSREKLEYDHIVPVSKGGSNTTRNIELLCEKCNRSKSANIE